MAKLVPEEVTLVDVAEIAADPAHRTATTPFGALPGRAIRYVGRAVMWKRNPAAMPDAVRKGLDKAISISKGCKGVLGIGVNPLTGEVVPNKVICQLRAAKKIK
ncbi:hypothetical protein ES703_06154 [subsurface metagenome]